MVAAHWLNTPEGKRERRFDAHSRHPGVAKRQRVAKQRRIRRLVNAIYRSMVRG